jgi:hypothetical protein
VQETNPLLLPTKSQVGTIRYLLQQVHQVFPMDDPVETLLVVHPLEEPLEASTHGEDLDLARSPAQEVGEAVKVMVIHQTLHPTQMTTRTMISGPHAFAYATFSSTFGDSGRSCTTHL